MRAKRAMGRVRWAGGSRRRGGGALLSLAVLAASVVVAVTARPEAAAGWTPPIDTPIEWRQVPFEIQAYQGVDEADGETVCWAVWFLVIERTDAAGISGIYNGLEQRWIDPRYTALVSDTILEARPQALDIGSTYTYDSGIEVHDWTFGPSEMAAETGSLGGVRGSVVRKGPTGRSDTISNCQRITDSFSENTAYYRSITQVWNPTDPAGFTARPVASFTAEPDPDDPLTVRFTSTSTHPRYQTWAMRHAWQFDDGAGSSQVDPEHTFPRPGVYDVTLEVRTAYNRVDAVTVPINVGGVGLNGTLFNPAPNGSSQVREGEAIDLRLRVENVGAVDLTEVRVTDLTVTPTGEAPTGEATVVPLPGGRTLAGTLSTDPPDDIDFADYRVTGEAAGAVQVVATLSGREPDGDRVTSVASFDLTVRPAPLKVELEVSYAEPPGGADKPPRFQQDNDGDGEVDGRDHRIEVEVQVTNESDEAVVDVQMADPSEPLDFDDRYLGGGQVFLDPLDLPAAVEFGDLAPGATETLTFAYEAKESVFADATAIVQGRQGDASGALVTAVGRDVVQLESDLAVEVWMDVEERPTAAGQVVRLNGEITNLLEDRTLPDGRVEEAKDVAVILDPIVEGNAANGYLVPAGSGGRTPQGNQPFLVAPGDTVEVASILQTARTDQPTTGEVRYLVRAWEIDQSEAQAKAVEIDQSRVVVDEEGGRGLEFAVALTPVNLQPDKLEECETEIFDAIVTCNLWVGLREFGTGLAQLVPLVLTGSVELVRAGVGIIGWSILTTFTAAKAFLAGDPAAREAFIQEISVQIETFSNLGIAAAEGRDAIGNAIVEFFQEAEQVLRDGDTDQIVAWTARFLGENPDLGLAAIAKVRAARALFGSALPSASQSEATRIIVDSANEVTAAERAALRSKVDEAIARGENPATNGTFQGDEVVTNLPQVFRGIYGARKTELNRMLELAAKEDILIAFRSRSALAADMIRAGIARLKPMDVKTKGVNEIDIAYLGYRRESKGLVELVEPPIDWRLAKKGREAEFEAALDEHMDLLKENHPEIGADPVWEAEVRQRLSDRTKEWIKEVPNFRRYQQQGIDVQFGYKEQGLPESLDDQFGELRKAEVGTGTLRDPYTGKERLYFTLKMADENGLNPLPITGDIDIVAVLNSDRTPLTDVTKRVRVYRELSKLVGMQHGDSFTWINGEGQIKFMREHVAGRDGAEALVVAGSDGQARMGYFEERLSTVADAEGNEVSKTTFHLLTGGPAALVTDPAGGIPVNLPSRLDQLESYLLDPRFFVPGALERFIDGLEPSDEPVPFDPDAPAVRPDGEGGAEAYVPDAADAAPAPGNLASLGPLADRSAEPDPLDGVAREMAGLGFGPAAEPEVGAQGGRWVPFDAVAAAAASPTGRFPRGIASAIDGATEAGTSTLPVVGVDVLGVDPASPWFQVGDEIVVDPGGSTEERHIVASVAPLTTVAPLVHDHAHATSVVLVERQQDPGPTTTTTTTGPTTTSTPPSPTTTDPGSGPSTTTPRGTPTTSPAGGAAGGVGGGAGSGGSGAPIDGGELARTGTSAGDLAPLALALILGGAMVLGARARARRLA